jgi:hypothetical protein
MLLSELPTAILTAHYLFDYSLSALSIIDNGRRLAVRAKGNLFRGRFFYVLFNIYSNLNLKLQVVVKCYTVFAISNNVIAICKIAASAGVILAKLTNLVESISRLGWHLPYVLG